MIDSEQSNETEIAKTFIQRTIFVVYLSGCGVLLSISVLIITFSYFIK